MTRRIKISSGMFVLALPVALCGAYLRDHFNVWEESGVTLYIFAGVYLFTSFMLFTLREM